MIVIEHYVIKVVQRLQLVLTLELYNVIWLNKIKQNNNL